MLTSGSMSKTFADLVPPMMAESAGAPFDSPDWIFEIKLDGYWAPGSQAPERCGRDNREEKDVLNHFPGFIV